MGVYHVFNKGGPGSYVDTDPGTFQHTSYRRGSVGFKPSTPSPQHIFPAIKMFPELRYNWKILENPTGRRAGQESSFSHAIQEALNKMFAFQDSSTQELAT